MSQIRRLEADIAHCLPSNKTALLAINLSLKVSRLSIISNVPKLQSGEQFRMKKENIYGFEMFWF